MWNGMCDSFLGEGVGRGFCYFALDKSLPANSHARRTPPQGGN